MCYICCVYFHLIYCLFCFNCFLFRVKELGPGGLYEGKPDDLDQLTANDEGVKPMQKNNDLAMLRSANVRTATNFN